MAGKAFKTGKQGVNKGVGLASGLLKISFRRSWSSGEEKAHHAGWRSYESGHGPEGGEMEAKIHRGETTPILTQEIRVER